MIQTFKATLRVPTNEQYAFVEVSLEDTAEKIREAYYELTDMFKPKEGLSVKDYNDFIDKYLLGEMNGLGEIYHTMSKDQQDTVQTIKRSLARIKARQNKE